MLTLFFSLAFADAPDLFGFGARGLGMGGARTALVDDASSAIVNPAGVGAVHGTAVDIGAMYAIDRFAAWPELWWDTNRDGTIDATDPPLALNSGVDNALGIQIGITQGLGKWVSLGFNLHLPGSRLFRLNNFEPDLPHYFRYENRPQRYSLALALGTEPVKGLRFGVGVEVMPSVAFSALLTADAAITGSPEGNDPADIVGGVEVDIHEILLDVRATVVPTVGMQLDFGAFSPAVKGLTLGVAWRYRGGVPVDGFLDAQVNASLQDIGSLDPLSFSAIVQSGVSIYDHYLPMKLDLALAYRAPRWSVEADVRWAQWSKTLLPIAQIVNPEVSLPLVEIGDVVSDGNDYYVKFRDTWSVRVGSEVWVADKPIYDGKQALAIALRFGGGFEPTPIVEQGASSALLDAHRAFGSLGLGLAFDRAFGWERGRVRLDVAGQVHGLVSTYLPRSSAAPAAGYPRSGDAIPVAGQIYAMSANFGVDFK